MTSSTQDEKGFASLSQKREAEEILDKNIMDSYYLIYGEMKVIKYLNQIVILNLINYIYIYAKEKEKSTS